MVTGRKCLVTGAAGFVGASLVRRLARDGHEVHATERPQRPAWRLAELDRDRHPHVHRHVVDLTDRATLEGLVRQVRPAWVFHLAAYGGRETERDFDRMLAVNVSAAAALMDVCGEAGVQRFVLAGSSSEYGFKDRASREDDVLEPNSLYAMTKAAATHYATLATRRRALNAVTARLFSVFGPYEDPGRLIPVLACAGLDGRLPPLVSPTSAHDFVYIDDALDALVCLAEAPALPRSVYNVCTGRQTTLAAVVEIAREYLHIDAAPQWSSLPSRSWDSPVWVGDPSAIAADAGWRARCDFPTGFARTVEWLREHPKWRDFYRRRGAAPDASGDLAIL